MKSGLLDLLTKLSAVRVEPHHQEFLDEHFSLSPQWKTFRKKLRAKSFVEAIRQDDRADKKLRRYSEANAKHIQARGVPTFSILSQTSRKSYSVKYHADDDRFSCNCGDWIHARSHQTNKKRQDCKHISHVKNQLEYMGKKPEDLKKTAAMSRAALRLLDSLGLK